MTLTHRHATALAVVLLALAGCSSSSYTEDRNAQDDAAVDVCHEAIESLLKSPSTADFSDETVDHVGDEIDIDGSVDAENSFGAALRMTWTCSVEVRGDSVHVVDYDLDDFSY